MLGLMVLLAIGFFLLLLIGLPLLVSSLAKRSGAGNKVATSLAVAGFLLIFLSVFWDAIPTWIAFKYYADKEAGLKVYKTLEQWKQENPGVAEKIQQVKFDGSISKFGKELYPMNERFGVTVPNSRKLFLSVQIAEKEVIDLKTGEVMARYAGVGSGNTGGFASGGEGWWKVWLINSGDKEARIDYAVIEDSFRTLGRK
jgi:hypothetical protein